MRSASVWLSAALLLVSSKANDPLQTSDRFRLKWYGPQAASYDHPTRPTAENVLQKTLFVFDAIAWLPESTFSLKFLGDGIQEVYVENVNLFKLDVAAMKANGQVLNFIEYEHMEPSENDAMVQKYFNTNYSIFEVWHKNIKKEIRPDPLVNTVCELYLAYPSSQEERLTTPVRTADGNLVRSATGQQIDIPFKYIIYGEPTVGITSPTTGPSQGGTQITISGANFLTYSEQYRGDGYEYSAVLRPLVKFSVATIVKEVAIDGWETEAVYYQNQYNDVLEGWSSTQVASITPPQLLNESDVTLNVSMSLTFNRQSWFSVAQAFTTYDPSRIGFYQTLTVAQLQHLDVLWAGDAMKPSGTAQHLLLGATEMPMDTNKLWIPVPAHQAPDVPAGTPVACGSVIRLRHARTMRNLHASFEESLSIHQQSASVYGDNGYGNSGDNWRLECEPNLEHEYPYHWESFKWDKRFHFERFEFVKRNQNRFWHVGNPFRLLHIDTNKYLTFTGLGVSPDLCPLCDGYRAVTIHTPQPGTHQRWFVKHAIDVPVECPTEAHEDQEKLAKRWKVLSRGIRLHDFVIWRTKLSGPGGVSLNLHPCDTSGEFRIGKVMQLFRGSHMITVDEFILQRGVFSAIQVFEEPLQRVTHTIEISMVHGPLAHSYEHRGDAQGQTRDRAVVYVEMLKEFQMLP